MRVGLLVCDHVRDQHVGIHGDYPDMFTNLFSHREDVELAMYDVIGGELPESPSECHAWLTTGSRHSVNDDETWIRDLESFVRTAAAEPVPFVGICFGHQLLAKALGGSVVKSERGWGIGIKEVAIVDGLSWANGRRTYRVTNCHQDQVEDLPPGAEVLGWNDHCPVSMMGVGSTMIGMQGHPEMDNSYAEALIRLRMGASIPDEVGRRGLESLARQPDMRLLADWMLEFIEGAR